jgi:NAD(P)-dependent dehydrogenase (short-subunit alcohol dehydrogenase family)
MQIRDHAAIVTGGASGLGAACVRALAAAGAKVVIADRDGDRAAALADTLGGSAHAVPCDVTDETALGAAVAQAARLGPLRIGFACAGIGAVGRLLERDGTPMPLAAFERVLRVNLVGTFNFVRLAAAAMAQTDALADGQRGVLVQTASIAAFDGQVGQSAYAASKAAISGMTLPLARELARTGIRVCTIAPGTMDTPLLAGLPEAARKALEATIPFPARLGKPEEFAALALHIVQNDYLNGETLRLDGALRMPPR